MRSVHCFGNETCRGVSNKETRVGGGIWVPRAFLVTLPSEVGATVKTQDLANSHGFLDILKIRGH